MYKEAREVYSKYLKLVWKGTINIIEVEGIVYIEAYNHRTVINLLNSSIESGHTIKYFIAHLPKHNFVRCHNSFIVNLNHINIIKERDLVLTTGKQIDISIRKRKNCVNALEKFHIENEAIKILIKLNT
jgi:DNA-binding LytR/AlgR family response regulator